MENGAAEHAAAAEPPASRRKRPGPRERRVQREPLAAQQEREEESPASRPTPPESATPLGASADASAPDTARYSRHVGVLERFYAKYALAKTSEFIDTQITLPESTNLG